MNRKLNCIALVAILANLLGVSPFGASAFAQIIMPGQVFTVSGANFPSNFSEAVTLSNMPSPINSGQLLLSTAILPDINGGQWVDFTFKRVGASSLVNNVNQNWNVNISGLQFNTPALNDSAFCYWTQNDIAVSPIFSFGGVQIGPNPINPGLGSVFLFGPTSASNVNWSGSVFANPYSFIGSGGVNPATADGFHFAAHFAAIPEPGSLTFAGMAIFAFAGRVVARRRWPSRS